MIMILLSQSSENLKHIERDGLRESLSHCSGHDIAAHSGKSASKIYRRISAHENPQYAQKIRKIYRKTEIHRNTDFC